MRSYTGLQKSQYSVSNAASNPCSHRTSWPTPRDLQMVPQTDVLLWHSDPLASQDSASTLAESRIIGSFFVCVVFCVGFVLCLDVILLCFMNACGPHRLLECSSNIKTGRVNENTADVREFIGPCFFVCLFFVLEFFPSFLLSFIFFVFVF